MFVVFLQNSYCTHHAFASVAIVVLETVLLNHCVVPGSAVIVNGFGVGAVTSILISFADANVHVFHAPSETYIHTYFVLFVSVLSVQLVLLFG